MSLTRTIFDRRQFLGGIGLAGLASIGMAPSIAAQRSPFATPTVDEPSGSVLEGPLGTLLAMVPLSAVEAQTQGSFWAFSDFARQFQALGMTHGIDGPDTENEPFVHATYALAAGGSIMSFAMVEDLWDLLGFRPFGLDQILYVGNPPNQLQLLRAPFDGEALVATWQTSGYEERVASTGESIWTIGPDREFSVENPIQQMLISEMNNLALVGDVIIACPTLVGVEQVLIHLAEGGASLLDEPNTGPLVATMPETTVSAMAVPASALAISPMAIDAIEAQADEIEAIRDEFGLMPPIQGLITGVNEGAIIVDSDWSPDGTPVATPRPDAGSSFWRVNAGTPEDAEQVLAIAEARWNSLQTLGTGAPYADYMEITGATVEGSLVEFDFRLLRSPQTWYQMIFQQDLLPLAPDDPAT